MLRAAAEATFNLLHVCGKALDFRRFAGYPVHVINWADRSAGPPIAEVAGWVRPAIAAGVDNLGTMVARLAGRLRRAEWPTPCARPARGRS